MKKFSSIVLASILLTGCGAPAAPSAAPTSTPTAVAVAAEDLKILAPAGAPGYSLLPIVKEGKNDVEIVDGAQILQAAFVSKDHAYDVIVAPTNLGVKLASAGKTTYKLAGIVTTGNLYVVSEDENFMDSDQSIALFGEGAVPGLVYNSLFPDSKIIPTWYASVQEAQAALLSGQTEGALLADPAATAAIVKGKEAGKSFKKVADLQELWGEDGYPQAGLFVEESTLEENKDMYAALLDEMIAYTADVKAGKVDPSADLDALHTDMFGTTPSAMVAKAYEGMGIDPMYASDKKEDVQKFMDLFGVKVNDETIVDLHD